MLQMSYTQTACFRLAAAQAAALCRKTGGQLLAGWFLGACGAAPSPELVCGGAQFGGVWYDVVWSGVCLSMCLLSLAVAHVAHHGQHHSSS
jgi:hypothetical protein